ncbi:MAG: hypothetical protein LBG62_07025 [Candidatus Methanoplasma sp.]|jgi:isocitrate/isopropylmalate dehydrogenase|nr:hypothetical protein [Candidatus Methanoplasma sp.]
MPKKILALPGDGVGPEVVSAAASVVEAVAGGKVEIAFADIGESAFEATGHRLPPETIDLATEADAIIAGTVADKPSDRRYGNPVRALKKQLGLYAVLRRFSPLLPAPGRRPMDVFVVTGNPDALLNVTETESLDGVMMQKYLSAGSCARLFRKTAQVAEAGGRRRITCAHRAAAFPASDGLFLDRFYKEFAASEFMIGDMEVEQAAAEMVMDPGSMDVIVSTDLYGSVLAGVGAGLVGGGYLTPMGSLGDSSGLFEPMHGPRADMADKGEVNPTSAILSAAMALDQAGLRAEAEAVRASVRSAYARGAVTPDAGGSLGTAGFCDEVVEGLKKP